MLSLNVTNTQIPLKKKQKINLFKNAMKHQTHRMQYRLKS